jgi:hypothetical protein
MEGASLRERLVTTTTGIKSLWRKISSMWLLAAALPFTALGFSSFVLTSRMIELINQKLPHDQQIESYRYPGKMKKVRAMYREHHPAGRLARWELVVEAIGAVWFFVVAAFLLHSK